MFLPHRLFLLTPVKRRYTLGMISIVRKYFKETKWMAIGNRFPKGLAADLILINGNILTVDDAFSRAQAIAVKNGRFIYVADEKGVSEYTDDSTEVINLKGTTVLPGINDSHIHASLYGGSRPPITMDISSPAVTTVTALVDVVALNVQKTPPDEWIKGVEFNLGAFKDPASEESQYPTRWDLDPVSPNNPVVLGGIPFHACPAILLNSQALAVTGINRDTIAPHGIEIIKDGDSGEPTGLVRGINPEGLLEGIIPLLSRKQKQQAIQTSMQELNALGITSITEPGLGPGGNRFHGGLWDNECVHLYNELNHGGELTLRVSILLLMSPYGSCYPEQLSRYLSVVGTPTGFGSEWLRIGGLKLFADGIPPMKTAWMYEPYNDGSTGFTVFPGKNEKIAVENIRKIVGLAHDLGFQVAVHATGDRAIDVFVDSFVEAETKNPRGLRHYIIHGDFVTRDALKKMADYGIGLSIQPALMDIMAPLMKATVGESKMRDHLPLGNMFEIGVHVAGGSDAPVTTPDWKAGIKSAVSEASQRRISIENAIRMYTVTGAWQDHMERQKGSIEIGKFADLCVLDDDITQVDVNRITALTTVLTMVGGKIVYRSGL